MKYAIPFNYRFNSYVVYNNDSIIQLWVDICGVPHIKRVRDKDRDTLLDTPIRSVDDPHFVWEYGTGQYSVRYSIDLTNLDVIEYALNGEEVKNMSVIVDREYRDHHNGIDVTTSHAYTTTVHDVDKIGWRMPADLGGELSLEIT